MAFARGHIVQRYLYKGPVSAMNLDLTWTPLFVHIHSLCQSFMHMYQCTLQMFISA
jgi:hypothetical protein